MRTMNRFRITVLGGLLALVGLGGAGEAKAQAGTTTGAINVRAVTPAELPLGSVQVTALNQDTGFERGGLTAADGRVTLRLLPPGIYTVRAQFIGYRTEEIVDVRVTVGQTAQLVFELQEAAVAVAGIEVRGRAQTINTRDASVRQTVSEAEISSLPALGRDFTDFIALSGLVAPIPEETTGGQFALGGQRPSQTNLQIDGADANNSFFGENRGGSRVPFTFSLESIREFEIITNGFDVEFGNYSGGVVNVVTRGGTNRLEGNVYANLRNDALTANTFAGNPVEEYRVNQFAGRISGPIVRDRAFFLLSMDGQIRREPRSVLSRASFLEGDTPDEIGAAEFDRYLSILENQYGIEDPGAGYGNFQTQADQLSLFGRVDWTLNENHRLSARHNYAGFVNADLGGGFTSGRSGAERLESTSHSFVAELQSVLGRNTSNVARFQYATERRPRDGNEIRPRLIVDNLGQTQQQVQYGGTNFAFQNRLEEDKLEFSNVLNHVVGNHTFKVGGRGMLTSITNQFIAFGAGQYRFRNLDDLENFRPYQYTRDQRGDGRLPLAQFDVLEWAIFAQDEWRLTDRLTTTLGLRYDQQIFRNRPERVVDLERAFGVTTGVAPYNPNNLSPRINMAWDRLGDGSSVVRGGFGYYHGRIPYVLGGNVEQTEVPILSLLCDGDLDDNDPNAPPRPTGYRNWGADGSDNPFTCNQGGDLRGIPTYTLWQEDFRFPSTLKYSLGYEQLLGNNTRAALDLVYTDSRNLYTVRNINLRDAQFTLENEGGRQVYVPREQFVATGGGAGANNRRNTDFAEVYVNYNDGLSRAFSTTFELEHRFEGISTVRGSYTYTTSYDNSSYSCCTANAGFTNPRVGTASPNEVGGVDGQAWGPSSFVRNHTLILSGTTVLPLGIRTSMIWRWNTGAPWGPENSGDLNGDGVNFNDRPFIFAPEDLPLATSDPAVAQEQRERYAGYLADNPCVGDYQGQIIPRNTCRQPSFNRLDVRFNREFSTVRGQHLGLEVDLFNVLNGLNSEWGQYVSVSAARRNLINPSRFNQETGQIEYTVPTGFGNRTTLGANLLLQFQAQVGLRYRF
jgi:outer membrane receptor for ferrienterochelin and colicin